MCNNQVHIWRASLNLSSTIIAKKYQFLSAEEKSKAAKKIFQKDRSKFIASRGILRNILSRYLHVDPAAIEISYSPQGKPYLANSYSNKGLNFNLSHSHELALYAITLNRKVGVDLEYIQNNFEYRPIIESFFSNNEIAQFKTLPPSIWPQAFYACWTRKEAYVKAKGGGLAIDLKKFTVSVKPGEAALLSIDGMNRQEIESWILRDIDLGLDYTASIAVKGGNWLLKKWEYCPQIK